ncbi:MAG TPA: sialidase family protein [Mycobacteriales bacterium]|nr:sialidase family protein [Mycobacteriales bacterium]
MHARAALLLAPCAAATALLFSPALAASPPPSGCAGRAAPVAYRPGHVLANPPSNAPRVCGFTTGFPAAESHIVVTGKGQVVFTPAVAPSGLVGTGEGPGVAGSTQGNATPGGLAVTADDGEHWSMVQPDGVTWNPTDHGEYVDPRSGRFFFEDYGPIPLAPQLGADQEGPAYISWSDDLHTWQHSVLLGLTLPENPRFTSGIAPSGQPTPGGGYPSVLYFCANTNVGFTSPAIVGRLCYRSLDGGSSWTMRSQLLNALVPRHAECGTSGENLTAVDGYYPESTRDGSLYTLVACGGKTFLARSTDEAATFPVVHTASGPVQLTLPVDSVLNLGSGPQLRIDDHDNFYVVYPSSGGGSLTHLLLITSTDRGLTWSKPADITPPGVASILRWSVAVRHPGELALSLVAQRAGQSTFDAVMASTTNALEASPLLWSAVTNTAPILYASHISGAGYIVLGQGQIAVPDPFPLGIQPIAGPLSAGQDFIGVTIGPDGTVWGSFDADCGPTAKSAGCVASNDQTHGFVGALRPHVAPARPPTKTPVKIPAKHPTVTPPGHGLAATGVPRTLGVVALLLTLGAGAVLRARTRGSSSTQR